MTNDIDVGIANQKKPAAKKPKIPSFGLAAIRLCQLAWSQNIIAIVMKSITMA